MLVKIINYLYYSFSLCYSNLTWYFLTMQKDFLFLFTNRINGFFYDNLLIMVYWSYTHIKIIKITAPIVTLVNYFYLYHGPRFLTFINQNLTNLVNCLFLYFFNTFLNINLTSLANNYYKDL